VGIVGDLANLGSGAWEVISGDAPSAEVSSGYASAVPKDYDPSKLSSPTGTGQIRRSIYVRNASDDEVINFQWDLFWEYGSTYDGEGAFIPRCWLSPGNPHGHVSTGWHVNLKVEVGPITNDNGVARMPLVLPQRVHSMFGVDDETTTFNFVVYGDGRHDEL
jgi:hypothetical protein